MVLCIPSSDKSSWMFKLLVTNKLWTKKSISMCLLVFLLLLENNLKYDSSFFFPIFALKSPVMKRTDVLVILPILCRSLHFLFITFDVELVQFRGVIFNSQCVRYIDINNSNAVLDFCSTKLDSCVFSCHWFLGLLFGSNKI